MYGAAVSTPKQKAPRGQEFTAIRPTACQNHDPPDESTLLPRPEWRIRLGDETFYLCEDCLLSTRGADGKHLFKVDMRREADHLSVEAIERMFR